MKIVFYIFIMSCFCSSCSFINLKAETHYTSIPSREYETLKKEDLISIRFSEDVDKNSVESITSIRRRGAKEEINFNWENGNFLILETANTLFKGMEYRLDFQGIYQNMTGKELLADLSIPFYWENSEFSPLQITTVNPPEGDILKSDSQIQISFNKTVNPKTLTQALKISPPININKFWAPDLENTLIIEPRETWDNLTSYTLSLDETLHSKEGSPLYPNWKQDFFIENGSSTPFVKSWGSCSRYRFNGFSWIAPDLENLAGSQAIRIRFSEAMNHEICESSFQITPVTDGEIYWIENDLIFCPDTSFRSSQSFRIKIDENAESINGIRMADHFILDFSSSVESLRLLSLECSSPGGFLLNELNSAEACDLPIQSVSPFSLSFHFTFSEAFNSDSEKQRVQDSLSFYRIFGSGTNPQKSLFSWISDYRMTAIYSGFSDPGDAESYYLMELPGGKQGIFNSDGSYLDETVSQLFRMGG